MPELLYDVDNVSQQTSATCWLACAVMVYQYKRQSTPPSSWLDATVPDFRGRITVPPGAESPADQVVRMRRMGFVDAGFNESRNGVMRTMRAPSARSAFSRSGFSESGASARPSSRAERIYQMLVEFGPFIFFHRVGSFSYGPGLGAISNPEGRDSHAVVITGVNTARNRVYFNNPWGQSHVMTTADSIAEAATRFESETATKSVLYYP